MNAPFPLPLRLSGVGVVHGDATVLDGVDWEVGPDDRWVVLGPNGSGKTTLLRVAGLYLHPSRGEVEVLGHRWGRVDVRWLRTRIGFVSPALAGMLRPDVTAIEVVMAAREAALETWWHAYGPGDRSYAHGLLERMGVAAVAGWGGPTAAPQADEQQGHGDVRRGRGFAAHDWVGGLVLGTGTHNKPPE